MSKHLWVIKWTPNEIIGVSNIFYLFKSIGKENKRNNLLIDQVAYGTLSIIIFYLFFKDKKEA